jgi:signal transduction histidine kinase
VQVSDKVNILLVDDQPARLLTYQSVLGELGQNLVLARSGVEALEKLMREEFAVVLLDVSMPEMDGFEAARLIHDHPRFERTPIIFVTGVHITELDRLKGYKVGAVDYVSIPVVPEILRSKVAVLVELYCKRRELRELNRSLAQTNERLAEANAALQAEKARELETLNTTLQRANWQLECANRSLQNEVAERAKAEAALKEADRNKDEFLAMLAHELRNPLAPILNALHLMRVNASEGQLRWSREVIERQLSHLTRLVDDLLDVSRITRGKIALCREPLELTTLIAHAVETVQPLLEERGHALIVDAPDRTLAVNGDLLRLTQAIGNVLGNAAKYTERGGRIGLSVGRDGAHVEIRVRDNGIGISAERLPRIFDLFTQFDRGAEHGQGGLGIGLGLVQRLVQMHEGTVSVRSDGIGTGSEFTIRLPLLDPAMTMRAPSADRKTPGGEVRQAPPVSRRILVADDNPDALESLALVLQLQGHEVFSANNGGVALESAERYLPDVVLLDVGMPVLDGYEVARRIRAQPWGKQVTLLALTGWGQDSDRRRSQEAGFDLHLVKPVDVDKLTELLAHLPRAASDAADPAPLQRSGGSA